MTTVRGLFAAGDGVGASPHKFSSGSFTEGRLAARDRHELLRCWELVHRAWVGEAHLRHLLFRKETRWPGYYYRSDYPDMDEANWRVFVNSRYDPQTGQWHVFTKPFIQVFK
jgi:adenylylsulfate reductase subunit A